MKPALQEHATSPGGPSHATQTLCTTKGGFMEKGSQLVCFHRKTVYGSSKTWRSFLQLQHLWTCILLCTNKLAWAKPLKCCCLGSRLSFSYVSTLPKTPICTTLRCTILLITYQRACSPRKQCGSNLRQS